MKNLSIRFILAGLVAGFTYLAFLTSLPANSNVYNESSSFLNLLAEGHLDDSSTISSHEEHVRKLNYAKFRKSLLRHRSIYYAKD